MFYTFLEKISILFKELLIYKYNIIYHFVMQIVLKVPIYVTNTRW